MGVQAGLLCGNLPAPRRREVLAWLRSGKPGVVFGTHALIQRTVEIPRLGLAVIDEQHRFGVFDRVRLRALGPQSDMLLLSATPIPRSLARVLLSNLEVTMLDERPAGRPPVTTRLVEEGALEPVWRMVRERSGERQPRLLHSAAHRERRSAGTRGHQRGVGSAKGGFGGAASRASCMGG